MLQYVMEDARRRMLITISDNSFITMVAKILNPMPCSCSGSGSVFPSRAIILAPKFLFCPITASFVQTCFSRRLLSSERTNNLTPTPSPNKALLTPACYMSSIYGTIVLSCIVAIFYFPSSRGCPGGQSKGRSFLFVLLDLVLGVVVRHQSTFLLLIPQNETTCRS